MSWAPPRSPGGLDGPHRKHFTASSEIRLLFYLNHFPSPLWFACYFLLPKRGGRQRAGGCCRTCRVLRVGAELAEEQPLRQGLMAQDHSPSLPPVP